jgi:hypothetical protein
VLGEILTPERETEARDSLVQSLALYREVGDLLGVASDENLLGRLDWLYGRHAAAGDHYRASLRLTKDWSWMQRIVQSLAGLAVVAAGLADPERALRLAAASARLDQEQSPGNQLTPHERREFDRALGSVWDLLSAPRVAALQAEGEALTLEQAIAYALEEDGD